MALFQATELQFVQAVSELAYCNPFTPERIGYEQRALGERFVPSYPVWQLRADLDQERPNIRRIMERVTPLADDLRRRLLQGTRATREERVLYEDVVLYMLYHRYREDLHGMVLSASGRGTTQPPRFRRFAEFAAALEHYVRFNDGEVHTGVDPLPAAARLLAMYFQIHRAFYHIFSFIVGGSMPAARLRVAAWQSIFTHDMRRYRRTLFDRMGDVTTLIVGPSGTGKELVARAIGLSRYIPFDAATGRFAADFAGSFYALNLSALSPTLIESELFGHKRGAFTGALADRAGWLEVCPALGTVFLDEIGELDASIQVKLLRVLQERTFQSLGDTTSKAFAGKIIAATNRDLAPQMAAGRFRRDFYYRLCADVIATPSLQEQLADSPGELHNLVLFLAKRLAGPEADALADEVETWIEKHLGREYPWPGNIRELEQCVRNVMIRREYHPPHSAAPSDNALTRLQDAVAAGDLTADELLSRYVSLVYARTGSYEEAGRRLGFDRRTVKAKVDEQLVVAYRAADKVGAELPTLA